mmetsp:Transcript_3287/g.6244  ORF Transcript_3287/g.6244 Transcript_3287/m.6244 type:complete len:234 (-) Transcript_3287:121-822(-)
MIVDISYNVPLGPDISPSQNTLMPSLFLLSSGLRLMTLAGRFFSTEYFFASFFRRFTILSGYLPWAPTGPNSSTPRSLCIVPPKDCLKPLFVFSFSCFSLISRRLGLRFFCSTTISRCWGAAGSGASPSISPQLLLLGAPPPLSLIFASSSSVTLPIGGSELPPEPPKRPPSIFEKDPRRPLKDDLRRPPLFLASVWSETLRNTSCCLAASIECCAGTPVGGLAGGNLLTGMP